MSFYLKGEVWFFCTLRLIKRIFTITYNVLQHYYDKQMFSGVLSCTDTKRRSMLTTYQLHAERKMNE